MAALQAYSQIPCDKYVSSSNIHAGEEYRLLDAVGESRYPNLLIVLLVLKKDLRVQAGNIIKICFLVILQMKKR